MSFSISFTRVEVDGKAIEVRLEGMSEQRNGPGRTIENLEPVDLGRTIFDSDHGIVPDCEVSGMLSHRTCEVSVRRLPARYGFDPTNQAPSTSGGR